MTFFRTIKNHSFFWDRRTDFLSCVLCVCVCINRKE
jgi:hypothetical protein